MPPLAYVDGQYLPHGSARMHIEGRGHQFSTVSLLPIVRIDGHALGSGVPGPLARRLREHSLVRVPEAV